MASNETLEIVEKDQVGDKIEFIPDGQKLVIGITDYYADHPAEGSSVTLTKEQVNQVYEYLGRLLASF